nr:phytanoyl-CoA dioxygenase family protein [Oceanococcus sp. HetDA_MAG_MS8]
MNTFGNFPGVEQFSENGFLVVPGVLDQRRVELLIKAWEALSEEAIRHKGQTDTRKYPVIKNILTWEDGNLADVNGKASLHIEHAFRYHRAFLDVVHDPRIVATAKAVLGPDVRLLDDQLYHKPARTGGVTYWHRDSDFFLGVPVFTVWMPLDDVDAQNGCLTVVPGSHQPGYSSPGIVRKSNGTTRVDNQLNQFYEVDPKVAECKPVAMQRGDALLIHRDLLHCSFENTSVRQRRSYLVEYFDGREYEGLKSQYPDIFRYHHRHEYNLRVREKRPLRQQLSQLLGFRG